MAKNAILTTNQPTSEGGAGCQTNCAWSGSEEKLFLLTSPFIELAGGPVRLGPLKNSQREIIPEWTLLSGQQRAHMEVPRGKLARLSSTRAKRSREDTESRMS